MSALSATAPTSATLSRGQIKRRLRRAEWRGRLKAIGLVAPLFLFLVVFFLIPMARMLWLSVDNSELPGAMPRFAAAVQQWDPAERPIPDEDVLAFSITEKRILLTINRKHFIRLHRQQPDHAGIIVCTFDLDFVALGQRIHNALVEQSDLSRQLIRINRPG